ncbi:MAG: flagellar export chaperone FliS [Terracidiphilus sp.]
MDIVIHLQATLKKDVGGKPAESLSDFYVAMFALMLQGSQANSRKKFEQVIAHVRNVRDAWKQVAADPKANQFAASARPHADIIQPGLPLDGGWNSHDETHTAVSWTA